MHSLDGGARTPGLTLEMSLGRYPGPIWTAAVLMAAGVLSLVSVILFGDNPELPTIATNFTLIFNTLVIVILMVLGARMPWALLWTLFVISILTTAWLVYDAATPLGSTLYGLGFVMYATYLGLWASKPMAYVLLAGMATAFLIALVAGGLASLAVAGWLPLMLISLVVMTLLLYIVRHLRDRATIDPLTGLLNRVGLETLLELAPSAGRSVEPRALIILDLDNFKTINDTAGHLEGDRTLRRFGAALRECTRNDDIVARTGGDEFVIIAPRMGADQVEGLVARLRRSTAIEWSHGAVEWPATMTFDDAVARADGLMYVEKRHRRTS